MINPLQCLTLCLAIEKSLSERMVKMSMDGSDDDKIILEGDMVTDNCSENTKTMVADSIQCSRE